ncbi:MAG: MBL fold metallo-hydrolase [Proteobacteria bacterium]|nr:MBL fold metallo-hydrolase [Pseudomonadota bacterium]
MRTSLCALRFFIGLVAFLVVVEGGGVARADDRCIAVASLPERPRARLAQWRTAEAQAGDVRLTFVGHSTFLIESGKGVRIATDYNDYVRPAVIPDIATMNRAHSSHFSVAPDPQIGHVLRGWTLDGGPAHHDVTEGDVRVRNVPTNIRSWTTGGTEEFGNSIFIFEVGNLCIAHLGHLHHTLSERQIGQIGQMDVVLAPVDGSYTLDISGMIEVLKGLKAPLVIPMHYFSSFTLSRFLDAGRADYEIKTSPEPTITINRKTLPTKPQILVLPGN